MASRPWSPIEIETAMATLLERQDEAIADLRQFGIDFATKRRDYEKTRTQAFLRAKVEHPEFTTDAQRVAHSVFTAADARFEKDCAEAAWVAQRAVVTTLASEGDTLRSLARSSRDLTDGPGFGNGGRS